MCWAFRPDGACFALDENIRGLILLCRWRSGRRTVGAQKRLHAVSG